MKKINVALLFGGRSPEHEVSINSARNIAKALDQTKFNLILIGISKSGTWYSMDTIENLKVIEDPVFNEKYPRLGFTIEKGQGQIFKIESNQVLSIDVVFPILHGSFGEDGCVQGFLKILNLPFAGCGVLSSAAGMDKDTMKKIFTQAGIPNAPYEVLYSWSPVSFQKLSQNLGLPFFIKPANAGSSVGVHKIKSQKDFEEKLQDSFSFDSKVLAEKFIQGREIEISVLGPTQNPQTSLPGEIRVLHDFYSYEAKYLDDRGAEIVIPATLSASLVDKLKTYAMTAYSAIGATGFSRIDFFLQDNGNIYLNEINTLPGFTNISMYPKMWEASGLKYSDLISKIIELGIEQHLFDKKFTIK